MEDLITKKQMRTILSSLKDYVDTNREENLINIKQNIIGNESDWLTEGNTTKTITLTDDINNYDYLVFELEFRRGTNTSYENHTALARVGYTNVISIDHSIGSDDADGTYIIKVSISASGTGASIYQGARGSAYSGARIKQVIGIKLTKNLDNATSLDETLLYSGNDQITSISGYKNYTLLDNVTNYDYIYIEVKTVATDGEVSYTFTGTYKQPKLAIDSLVYLGNSQGGTTTVAQFGGWIQFSNDNTISFALRNRGSDIASVYLSKVIGIKKNSLSTADIAEMAMPSDVYVTISVAPIISNGMASFSFNPTENGYVYISCNTKQSNTFINFLCDDHDDTKLRLFMPVAEWFYSYQIAISKSTKCTIQYPASQIQDLVVKFIYSIGDAKALGLI